MFLAAFSSRSRIRPQWVKTWVRTDRLLGIGYPQVFQIDRVVGPQQPERRLMVKVRPLTAHLLMLAGQQLDCLFAAFAALLALLEGDIVERATAPQDPLQCLD